MQSQNTFALHSIRCPILQELPVCPKGEPKSGFRWLMVMGVTLVQLGEGFSGQLRGQGTEGVFVSWSLLFGYLPGIVPLCSSGLGDTGL